MEAALSRARVGDVLDRKYRLIRLLGEGGMGAVFEAENIRIDRRVAVKVLREKYSDREDVVHRFMQEAKAAGMIGHAGICQVLDLGELADGSPFLVMELMRGIPLSKALEVEGGMPGDVVACVLVDVLSALQAAHSKGIVHRDLKPDNVFLAKHEVMGVVSKILDFGISKFTQGSNIGLTQTGTVMGTPLYMSPEQALGLKEIDHRVDIYACGVIGYEALTGVVPWKADNYNALMQQILGARYPRIAEVRPGVPPGIAEIVAKAMDRDPKNRFATADDMAAAIRAEVSEDRLVRARAKITDILSHQPSIVPPAPSDELPVPSMGGERDSGIRPSSVSTTPHGSRAQAMGEAPTAMSPAHGIRVDGLPAGLLQGAERRPSGPLAQPGAERRPSGPLAQPGAERRPSGPIAQDRRNSGPTYRPFDLDADRWRHETQSGDGASPLRTPLMALGGVVLVGVIALGIAAVATGYFSDRPAPVITEPQPPATAGPPLARPDPGTDLVDRPPTAPAPFVAPTPPPAVVATPSAAAARAEGLLDRPLVTADAGVAAAPATVDRRRRPTGAPTPPRPAPTVPAPRRGPFSTEYPD